MSKVALSEVRDMFAHEAITISNVSKALTAATYEPAASSSPGATSVKPAQYAIITTETADIRVYYDGTTADASGHLVLAGSVIELFGVQQVRNFRAIRNAAADASIKVSYGR